MVEMNGPRAQWNARPAPTTPIKATNPIRVAIAGVGNCASSLVQGRYFYADVANDAKVPGLMHVDIGGYHVRDLDYVAAFDVNVTKVGKDLSVALGAEPNNTWTFQEIPTTGVIVQRGPTLDGIGKYLKDVVIESPEKPVDVAAVLKERKVDVLVAYLPVGSEEGIRYYAEQAIKAGCAFVNAIPVFIGREPEWQKKFAAAGLPIVGDDIKSQVGATIAHRVLARLFADRGVQLDRTYQLNFGGNTDFQNMLERDRLESKKISKTNAVTSILDEQLGDEQVHVGPSDFVPWLLTVSGQTSDSKGQPSAVCHSRRS